MHRPASVVGGVLTAVVCAGALDGGPRGAAAGAWTLPAGEGLAILGAEGKVATEAFTASGRLRPRSNFTKAELSAYFEYGLVDRLTVMVAPRFEHIDIAPPFPATRTGFSHTEIGARWNVARFDPSAAGLWQGSVFSLQATARLPGAVEDDDPLAGAAALPEYDARILSGVAFAVAGWTGFLDLASGFRLRDGPPPSEARLDLTLGLRPRPDVTLMAQAFLVETVEPGTRLYPAGGYLRAQFSTVVDLGPRWAVQFGGNTVIAGRNALREQGLLVAVWHRF